MNLAIVFETEKMIMNRVGWRLHLTTPRDLQEEILNEIFSLDENRHIKFNLQEKISNWVNFSMTEYALFKNYDQLTLTFASLLLTFKIAEMEREIQKLVESIKTKNLGEMEEIKNCVNLMIQLFNREDDEPSKVPESDAEALTQAEEESQNNFSDQENHQPNLQNFEPAEPGSPKKITRRRIRSSLSSAKKTAHLSTPKKQTKISDFVKIKKLNSAQRAKRVPKRI
jgi:hypothetical protein